MTPHIDPKQMRAAERERSLTAARAALRVERAQLAADRAEADRLLAEMQDAHVEATRERNRARKLAPRFVRWVKHRHAADRQRLAEDEKLLAAERDKLAGEFARLVSLRSEFHAAAAATRDRLRDAWAAVEAQQQRAGVDWAEAEKYFAGQAAELDARAAEVAAREKALADARARAEGEVVGLREEAAALEARVANARAALAELEAERERLRAELAAPEPAVVPVVAAVTAAPPPAPELAGEAGPADLGDEIARERAEVAALKESLAREAAELADRKRVVGEQLAELAAARARWQEAERRTVLEMEGMARDLRAREADLDAREKKVVGADTRRRDDAYELWQMRLKLEAWQSKLTAFEVRWNGERAQLEADLERRTAAVARREAEVEQTFAKWEKARAAERDRLRAELDHWAAERERLTRAAADVDLQRQLHAAELSTCAARALAAEEMAAAAARDDGSGRVKRRLAVQRKRWERIFDRKAKKLDTRRAEMTAELADLTDRYRRLHALLAAAADREAAANDAAAAADLRQAAASPAPADIAPTSGAVVVPELAALREELERVAVFLIDMDVPEPPGPAEQDLPWGTEEAPNVLSFEGAARAA